MNALIRCEAVARAAMGEPAKREGAELLYDCPYAARHKNGDARHSLGINCSKGTWGCAPCGKSDVGGWKLAAFLIGVSANNGPAVKAWLREHDLPKTKSEKLRQMLPGTAPEGGTVTRTLIRKTRQCSRWTKVPAWAAGNRGRMCRRNDVNSKKVFSPIRA